MDYSLKYSDKAMRLLRAFLFERYQYEGNLDAAYKLLAGIENHCPVLKTCPRFGRLLHDERLREIEYRKLVAGSYVVVYTLDDSAQVVQIAGVFHHPQNYKDEL